MTLHEARTFLLELVASYYGESHVFYAEAKIAGVPEPYITVKVSDTVRQYHAAKIVDDEGYQKSYREQSARFEINLYTKGRDASRGRGIPVYLNTAVNDLLQCVNYLDSDDATERISNANVAIIQTGSVRDLTALQNNSSSYQYRALMEGEIRFIEVSYGLYGQNQVDPTEFPDDSGGGSAELVSEPYIIEETDITGGTL